MNQQEFDKILEKRLTITRDVLAAKGKEYKEVGKRDRLHNFNRGAEMEKTTRERYLRSLWLKHLVLLFDIIDDWQEDKVTTEIIDEKIGDSINYLILLEAMLKEDIAGSVDQSQWTPTRVKKIYENELSYKTSSVLT